MATRHKIIDPFELAGIIAEIEANLDKVSPGRWAAQPPADYEDEETRTHFSYVSAPAWGCFARLVIRIRDHAKLSEEGLANLRHIELSSPDIIGAILHDREMAQHVFTDALGKRDERIQEAEALINYLAPALLVLRTMLKKTGLTAGQAKAEEMIAEIQTFLAPPDKPADAECDHKHWTFEKWGRRCSCGAMMSDPGD